MEASEKASMASGKAPRRITFTFCDLLRDEKRKPKPWSTNEFSHLAQKMFKFSATSPVPIRRSGQTFVLIGPLIVTDYGL